MMKRLILLLICSINFFTVLADDNKAKEKPIQLIIDDTNSQTDRNQSYRLVAVYYENLQTIFLEMAALGNASVYIVDSFGIVVECYTDINTDMDILINAPQIPGYYYLIIDSSRVYAEGLFEVK